MNLNDDEILDLNQLCNALIDGNISVAEHKRLEDLLANSENAREYYVTIMDTSASLVSYASEIQMEAPDAMVRRPGAKNTLVWRLAALAATIVLAVSIWAFSIWALKLTGPSNLVILPSSNDTAEPDHYVARLSGKKQSVWSGTTGVLETGTFIARGEHLELLEGFAEITFDSGARIILEGPAELDINSAWGATLRRGALTASVPPQAIGFRISNSAVDVVDQGTMFSMVADDQSAEVVVLEGEVEAIPNGDSDEDAITLHTNESRSFDLTGMSDTKNHDQLIARFSKPVSMERSTKPYTSAQWSLDESGIALRRAETGGLTPAEFDLRLLDASVKAIAEAEGNGVRNGSLRFEGELVANAQFPGLSGNSPRTIAFWVKVAKDSHLANAYSMVAWRANEKLGWRPVHIGWNRDPSEGPLGALRTDFSGGHAIGTTTLRDGAWHHVCVVFVPGEDPESPVQVKQYVDGMLESNKVTVGPKLSIARGKKPNNPSAQQDNFWLGCRLGSAGPKEARFRGEIDELLIADRSLEPQEIIELMVQAK